MLLHAAFCCCYLAVYLHGEVEGVFAGLHLPCSCAYIYTMAGAHGCGKSSVPSCQLVVVWFSWWVADVSCFMGYRMLLLANVLKAVFSPCWMVPSSVKYQL